MNLPRQVTIVPEGDLEDDVLKRLLRWCGANARIRSLLYRPTPGAAGRAAGRDTIRLNVHRYMQASRYTPYIALVDLEADYACAPELLADWGVERQPGSQFAFRIAVRSVEAWMLADARGLAGHLAVSDGRLPPRPDDLDRPKEALVNIARRSRSRTVKDSVVPKDGSGNVVGPGYTEYMREFVHLHWRVEAAVERSPSLARAARRLGEFVARIG